MNTKQALKFLKNLDEKLGKDYEYINTRIDFLVKGNAGNETIAHLMGYAECLKHIHDLLEK